MKKKLIAEVKRELRQELLEYAKGEKSLHDNRVETVDEWLKQKKLSEAYSLCQQRDTRRQQQIEHFLQQQQILNQKAPPAPLFCHL